MAETFRKVGMEGKRRTNFGSLLFALENVPLFGAKSLGVREGNHTTLPFVKSHDAEAEDCDEPSGAMHEV